MKKLTFWRYTVEGDSVNAKKYKVSSKKLRTRKTALRQLPVRIAEMGLDPEVWTYEELTNWDSDLDDDLWHEVRYDHIVADLLSKISIKWVDKGEKTFHSPPVKRGTYAFPEGMPEMFLVCWKEGNRIRKHEIGWSKPDLWCHHEEAAIGLGIPILETSGSWIRVRTEDYPRLLRRAINNDIKGFFDDAPEGCHFTIPHRSIGRHISLDSYEVFLV